MYDQILRFLQRSSIVTAPEIVELTIYGENQFRMKIRGKVEGGLTFQVWLNHNPRRTRYSYQLLRQEKPLLRWDNAPHHPEVSDNFPHHFHDAEAAIKPSELVGDPLQDIPDVLKEIERSVRGPARPSGCLPRELRRWRN